jgi:hypothetical protein
MTQLYVDTVSSHLTRDRSYRKCPFRTIVSKLQHMNAVVKHDHCGREYVNVAGWHVGIRPKKEVSGVLHVDIVTAYEE